VKDFQLWHIIILYVPERFGQEKERIDFVKR